MKMHIKRITILICIMTALTITAVHYRYTQLINDVVIVQYFDSTADNLDWQTMYIRAIVPERSFRETWTLKAIKSYVIIRSRNIPDRIDILIYDNVEKMQKREEYIDILFRK